MQELQTLLAQSDANSTRILHDCAEASAICTATIRIHYSDIIFDNIRDIIDIASENFGCLLSVSANLRFSAFKKHLAEQLYKGGGTYFKRISAEDKQHMNVDYAAGGGTNRSPTDFLKSQCYAFGMEA